VQQCEAKEAKNGAIVSLPTVFHRQPTGSFLLINFTLSLLLAMLWSRFISIPRAIEIVFFLNIATAN
jgi:hypothetical protein